jgi:tetratricopeptide (TPR) repeat protein
MVGVSPEALELVRKTTCYSILLLLAALCFTLATTLQPHASNWSQRGQSDNVLTVLLGDGRRLFANHYFVKADIYFHSGYYPSIFDRQQVPKDSRHMTAPEGSQEEQAHERQMGFLGPPRDWIERFGRHFIITKHTHLEHGDEREILPWLKLSAELNPQRIDTYTVAAFMLRNLGKVTEAEQFLREGLRANPNNVEILFDLGRLYYEDYHEAVRARNVWELALRTWQEQGLNKKEPDLSLQGRIADNLGRLEEQEGNLDRAIVYKELAKKTSPNSDELQKQIDELKQKLPQPPPASRPRP